MSNKLYKEDTKKKKKKETEIGKMELKPEAFKGIMFKVKRSEKI